MIFLVNNYLFRKKIGYYYNGDSNMDEKLEKVREMDAIGYNWKNAQWRNEDGSVAEW